MMLSAVVTSIFVFVALIAGGFLLATRTQSFSDDRRTLALMMIGGCAALAMIAWIAAEDVLNGAGGHLVFYLISLGWIGFWASNIVADLILSAVGWRSRYDGQVSLPRAVVAMTMSVPLLMLAAFILGAVA